MIGSWKSMARWSGTATAVLLAIGAVGLRDLEAAAIAAAVLVAVGLTHWRSGLLGLAGLALLGANVAFWMGAGAVSNLAHGEGFWQTALPSTLGVAALLTATSSVAAIATRRSRASATSPRVVAGAGVVLVVAALVAGAVGLGTAEVVQTGDVEIVFENVKFDPDRATVAAGEIGIHVTNRDLFWHTLTISELDIEIRTPVGASRRITFDAPPGTYEFVCAIPGHTQAGMKGTLTVR